VRPLAGIEEGSENCGEADIQKTAEADPEYVAIQQSVAGLQHHLGGTPAITPNPSVEPSAAGPAASSGGSRQRWVSHDA
jgi:hypothetical protein